jgi:uncharacterized membrane protein YjgN (DUF898 family)
MSGYYIGGTISPVFRTVAVVLIVLVLPGLIARSFRFRFHNSSYRGIRFAFSGSTGSAYWVFLGLPILSVLTLFLLVPFCHQRIKRYQHRCASYGQTRFTFDAPVSGFYGTYLLSLLLIVGLGIAFGLMAVARLAPALRSGAQPAPGLSTVIPLVLVAFYGSITFGVGAFMSASVQNLVWRHTRLGPHGFTSNVGALRLGYITLTNQLLTLCTLGFFQPFAQVRLTSYLASAFSLVPVGTLDDFVADGGQDVRAFGDEVMGFLDFDIAL